MIGLDTNVLVRYLAQDDPVQFQAAARLIEHDLTVEQPGFVSVVVMAETAWVLQRSYRWSGPELAAIVEQLLQADVLVVEHHDSVSEAVTVAGQGRGVFTDALISALARKAGCSHTVTFDRKALRLAGFAPA